MTGDPLNVLNPDAPSPRALDDVVAMAVVAQANVAQLRTAEARRAAGAPSTHAIQTPSPGRVTAHREALIDRRVVRGYSQAELHLRLHEVWGHFCVFCWALGVRDPRHPPAYAALRRDHELPCQAALDVKEAEIAAFLWRMRFEQRLRHEVGFRDETRFPALWKVARRVPATVFGVSVSASDDHALLVAACEHAGMLAAVRWIGDRRWAWGQAGIMDVDEASIVGASD